VHHYSREGRRRVHVRAVPHLVTPHMHVFASTANGKPCTTVQHATSAPKYDGVFDLEAVAQKFHVFCKTFSKMNQHGPICETLRAHRKASDERPGIVGNQVRGSLEKSLQCGCEYCMLSCSIAGKGDEIAKHREHNRKAVARNSELMFAEPEDPQQSLQEVFLLGEISKSGLGIKGDPGQREVFVVDRKFS
jgi:hypothetical protein